MRIAFDARYLGMVVAHRANSEMLMGVGAYSSQLVREMIRAYPGDQFYLITDQSQKRIAELLPGATVLSIPVAYALPVAKATIGRLYRGIIFDRTAFTALHRKHQFDVLHYLNPDIIPQPDAAKRTVVTVHDLSYNLFPEQVFRNPVSRWVWNYQTRTLNLCDMVITDSEATRTDVLRFCAIQQSKVRTVHCGVDAMFTAEASADDAGVVSRYGIDRSYFLHVGSIQPSKNMENLMAALAIVKQRHPSALLVIAGELSFFPADGARLNQLICQLGLNDHVHKTGFIAAKDLPALYRRAKALVQPSWYEGFGLTPLEAGACGCPAIVSDRGSLPEIMGQAGLVVNPVDPEAIAAGMIRMLDSDTRDAFGQTCRERSREFTWQAAADRIHEMYDSLLN